MRLDIYLNYFGNCEQAFRFYEQHLGGTITGIVRHREQPNPNVPADWGDKVLHARIEIGTTFTTLPVAIWRSQMACSAKPLRRRSLPLP